MSGRGRARIGVVGAGWWSTRAHLPALERHPDAVIAAIADPDAANRALAAGRFGVPAEQTYGDVSDMLAHADLDGAVVAVPHVAHAPVTRTLLEHGLPVLLEKPMTIEAADARSLEALARENGVELIIGYPYQYNRHVREVGEAVAEGRIGSVEMAACLFAAVAREIFRASRVATGPGEAQPLISPRHDTYSDPSISGGGQGQTLTTHVAALLISLVGRRAAEVTAVIDERELRVDLIDAAIVRFDGGALATIASTGSVLEGSEETLDVRLFGTEGEARIDVTRGEASIRARGSALEALATLAEDARAPEGAPVRNLVDVVLGRGVNESPAWLGVAAVELVDAMYRSAAAGRTVRVDQIP
jgi:predicted dehydrogenase